MARRIAPGTGTLLLDSDGLSRAAANDERTAAFIKQAMLERGRVVIPAVTLTEVLRGGARDAAVHRVLKKMHVVDVNGHLARAAGEILGQVGGDRTVNAIVAAVAVAQPGRVVVLTSDPRDLTSLTRGRGDIRIQPL
ncbi:MAG: type II toxin-antitoxin system VapC family toxin [Mycobacteriales bacterium]